MLSPLLSLMMSRTFPIPMGASEARPGSVSWIRQDEPVGAGFLSWAICVENWSSSWWQR